MAKSPSQLKINFDSLTLAQAESIAERLSRFTVEDGSTATKESVRMPGFYESLGIPANVKECDPFIRWNFSIERKNIDNLSSLLGYRTRDHRLTLEPVYLNLADEKRGGEGPHSVVGGITGKGKSHVLTNWVLGSCAYQSPDLVNYALMDYKGGLMFKGYEVLPHVVMNISNLEEEPDEVSRAFFILMGETDRREKLLREYGVVDSYLYRALWLDRQDSMPPLPELYIVQDEYEVFYKQNPQYSSLNDDLGMRGRAFGVHMVPCTQHPRKAQLGRLGDNITSGISMGNNRQSSAEVLGGSTIAEHLQIFEAAKWADIKKDTEDSIITFKSTNQTAPYIPPPPRKKETKTTSKIVRIFNPFTKDAPTTITDTSQDRGEKKLYYPDGRVISQENALIDHLSTIDVPKRLLWTKSLRVPRTIPDIPPIDAQQLAPNTVITEWRSYARQQWPQIHAEIGVVDAASWQEHYPLVFQGENTLIWGMRGSGKTTAAHTITHQLADKYPPRELSIFAIDCDGSGLQPLSELPHVQYTSMLNTRKKNRFFGKLNSIIDYRKDQIAQHEYSSIAEYFAHRTDDDPEDPYGVIVLLLDNINAWWDESREDMEANLPHIVKFGPNRGIFVIATTGFATYLKITDGFSQKFYLKMEDEKASSMFELTKEAKTVIKAIPTGQPGRTFDMKSYIAPKKNITKMEQLVHLQALIALPHRGEPKFHVDSEKANKLWDYRADYTQEIQAERVRISEKWASTPAPPSLINIESDLTEEQMLSHYSFQNDEIPLGLNIKTTFPFLLQGNHLIIAGGKKSGKTSTLRTIINGLVRGQWDEKPHIALFTINAQEFAQEQEILRKEGYGGTYIYNTTLVSRVKPIIEELQNRRSQQKGDTETAEDIMSATRFDGKHYFILVDGATFYTPRTHPELKTLAEMAKESIGLHIVITLPAESATMHHWTDLAVLGVQQVFLPGTSTLATGIEKYKFKAAKPGTSQIYSPGNLELDDVQIAYVSPW